MKSFFLVFILATTSFAQSIDSLTIRKIFDTELTEGKAYAMLDRLTHEVGGRLSGSPEAQKAVELTKKIMESYGFDRVELQEVMVPHWVRGAKEEAHIIARKSINVPICALGGSIATPTKGITAEVIEVHSFDELKSLGREKIAGKVVFYNRPMDPKKISTFEAYSGAIEQRFNGAAEAARYGAVGSIVRSMTLAQDNYPHTGSMRYNDSVTKIPGAAISTNAANILSSMLKQNSSLKFYFKINCQTLPDEKSYNVVGEIKGSEHPEEIILVGGHLDSWDLAQGAHDDGAGCVQSIEALRLFKTLGIQPKRTLRAVMFMNEENGTRGAKCYAELAKARKEKHLAAIESDAGGFSPRGFSIDTTGAVFEKILSWKKFLAPYGLHDIHHGGGGADVGYLKEQGALVGELDPDSQRYFDFHHAATDRFDGVNKRELEMGAASMAAFVYLLSEHGL